jgi:hypothetical protein
MRIGPSLALLALAGCAPTVHGTQMGKFVPDDAIAKVAICETTETELVGWFGAPSGRGQEGGFTTLQWMGAAAATDGSRVMTASQTIQVWVDKHGVVAGMTVNPASMPTRPEACPTGKKPATAAR